MTFDYNNTYKTFAQLMADIEDDLSSYTDAGHIEPDKYIRIVEKCSSFLSVKINPSKVATLDVVKITSNKKNVKGRAKLPANFKLWEAGFICHSFVERQFPEEFIKTTTTTTTSENECGSLCPTCNECSDTCIHITIEVTKETFLEVHHQIPLKLVTPHYACDDCNEPDFHNYQETSIEREGDDLYLNFAFDEGKIFIKYTAKMVSPNEILIYDHPLVLEYYEYAVKERILEDLWLNGKEQVYNKFQVTAAKHIEARKEAKRFVNTPDFAELREYYLDNRRRKYDKYFAPLLKKYAPHYRYNSYFKDLTNGRRK